MRTQRDRGFSNIELEAYVRSTIHAEAADLSSLLKDMFESHPMSEETQLIGYLLDLLVVASEGGEKKPKPQLKLRSSRKLLDVERNAGKQ